MKQALRLVLPIESSEQQRAFGWNLGGKFSCSYLNIVDPGQRNVSAVHDLQFAARLISRSLTSHVVPSAGTGACVNLGSKVSRSHNCRGFKRAGGLSGPHQGLAAGANLFTGIRALSTVDARVFPIGIIFVEHVR